MAKPIEEWRFDDENDKLHRKNIAKQFTSIILENSFIKENNGFVIALNSAWGTGKSSFIHMWKNMLNDEYSSKIKTIYYNAWESDDYEQSLIPIIAQIYDEIPESKAEIARLAAKALLGVIGKSTSQAISHFFGVNFEENIKYAEKMISKSITDDFKQHINNKVSFREELQKLTEECKVIVFIDELDRCKPTFAIDTLETIKHYLNVKDIIFIFSIDICQLSHSIATLYGQNMDANGYLARFFDLQLKLPEPSFESFINYRLGEVECFKEIAPTVLFTKIAQRLNLSLRDINQISNNIILFFGIYNINNKTTSPEEIDTIYSIYLFLISLKYKKPNILSLILYGDYINFNNSTTAQVVKIDDVYWKMNAKIQVFLNKLYMGVNKNSLLELIGTYSAFIIDDDIPEDEIHDEPVYKYIQRKLAFLDYIKLED